MNYTEYLADLRKHSDASAMSDTLPTGVHVDTRIVMDSKGWETAIFYTDGSIDIRAHDSQATAAMAHAWLVRNG